MKTITFDAVELPIPQVAHMRAAIAQARQASRVQLTESFVRERLEQLFNLLDESHHVFFDSNNATLSALRSVNLQGLAGVISALESRSGRTQEQKNSERQVLLEDGQRSVRQALDKVAAQKSLLDEHITRINRFAPPETAPLNGAAALQLTAATAKVDTLKAAFDAKQQAASDIRKMLDTFERPEWEAVLKKTIPSAKEIETAIRAAKKKGLDTELLDQAIEKLNQHIDYFGEVRQFKELAARQKQLMEELSESRIELDRLVAQAAAKQQVVDDLGKVDIAWQSASDWRADAEQIAAIYTAFLGMDLAAKAGAVDGFSEVSSKLAQMVQFIEELARANL